MAKHAGVRSGALWGRHTWRTLKSVCVLMEAAEAFIHIAVILTLGGSTEHKLKNLSGKRLPGLAGVGRGEG